MMKGIKEIKEETLIDSKYTLDMNEDNFFNDLPVFKGVSSSSIIFDQSMNNWCIFNGTNIPKTDAELIYTTDKSNIIGYHMVFLQEKYNEDDKLTVKLWFPNDFDVLESRNRCRRLVGIILP